jgi:hypothetical protein
VRDGSTQGLPSGVGRVIGGHGLEQTNWGIDEASGGSREERWRFGFVGT